MPYDFLILDLVFSIPALVILTIRRDLARVMGFCALASLPFAFTESWFYPTYWEPDFVFDLGAKLGFGIEDFLFVGVLAAFTSTAYAAVFRRIYVRQNNAYGRIADQARRSLILITAALVMAAICAFVHIPMIYGAVGIMVFIVWFVIWLRSDLRLPALWGGMLSLVIYLALCLVFAWLLPSIFDLTWHAERFSNWRILGVPLEELLYGFACGSLATVFYPFVTGKRFAPFGLTQNVDWEEVDSKKQDTDAR